ncbi:MAG: dicarboxylate transporter, DctP subunit [Ramlibacter sp.]|jgi:tripartite ATP-independent transporter DctP family solute receptor|nr:dicarboxylate transporter, DctP subunit [Ramlibacter sp.]
MKAITLCTIRLLLTAALAFTAHVSAQAQPVTLTLAHAAPITHPAYRAAVRLAKRIEERSGGQIKLEIFPAAQMGSQNETMEKVRSGSIDMTATSPDYLIKYDKAFGVLVMPYVYDSYEHAHRVLDGPAMQWLAPLAEKQGFVILANMEWGFRSITNNKRPINRPEDVRGLKIRLPPAANVEDTMQALGADVIKISANELYLALSQGVVDGQENPVNAIYYGKLYEVQKHLALTRHAYYNTLLVISKQSWAKLSPAQQTILREESKATGEGMRTTIMGEEAELVAKLSAAGMAVTRPDPQPFRALMEPAYQQIRLHAGEDNVRKFLSMVDAERGK